MKKLLKVLGLGALFGVAFGVTFNGMVLDFNTITLGIFGFAFMIL